MPVCLTGLLYLSELVQPPWLLGQCLFKSEVIGILAFRCLQWAVYMSSAVQFLAEHLRMRDVRMYIRDALSQYASLQAFTPQPSWNAECYTGQMLLEQFGFPYVADKDTVGKAYHWLANYGKEECEGKLPRREVEKEEFYEA